MKKIISLFMVLTMVLSLAACSTNQSPSESTPEEQPDSSAEAQQPTDEAGKTLVVYTPQPAIPRMWRITLPPQQTAIYLS